jgi:hypothetical protein
VFYPGLKIIPNKIGSGKSRYFFKTENRLSFNFDIIVIGNRFFKDISKTIITVNRLKTDDKVFW